MTVAPETTDRMLPPKGTADFLSKSFRSFKQSEKEIRKNAGKTTDFLSNFFKILKLGKGKERKRKTRVQSIDDLLAEYANLSNKYAEIKSESLSKDEKIKALKVVVGNMKKRLKEKEIEELKKDLMATMVN